MQVSRGKYLSLEEACRAVSGNLGVLLKGQSGQVRS